MPDTTVQTIKPQPALSTTSDMPTGEPAKAPEPKVETTKTEAAPKTEGTEEAGKPAKKPISERFSEVTAQRRAAEHRADAAVTAANTATDALNKALATIEKLTGKPAQETKAEIDKTDPQPAMPKRETFATPEAYDAALSNHNADLVQWAMRQATRAATADAEKRAAETKKADTEAAQKKANEDAQAAAIKAYNDRKAKVIDKYPDYADVAENPDLQITMPMSVAILNAENGPDVAYWLGQNPDQAARIATLTPLQATIEIGRISARLEASDKPAERKAPPPHKPLGASNAATEQTIYDIGNDPNGMEAYAAKRNQQLREARTRH